MRMIDEYLNSLESFLPDDLKQEVRDELEASIYAQLEDECGALGRELNQQEQEILLRKIGHPMRVAAAYLPNQELVGNEYFPAYKKALQIALSIALVSASGGVSPTASGSTTKTSFLPESRGASSLLSRAW